MSINYYTYSKLNATYFSIYFLVIINFVDIYEHACWVQGDSFSEVHVKIGMSTGSGTNSALQRLWIDLLYREHSVLPIPSMFIPLISAIWSICNQHPSSLVYSFFSFSWDRVCMESFPVAYFFIFNNVLWKNKITSPIKWNVVRWIICKWCVF